MAAKKKARRAAPRKVTKAKVAKAKRKVVARAKVAKVKRKVVARKAPRDAPSSSLPFESISLCRNGLE
jgi:hypothetical protein